MMVNNYLVGGAISILKNINVTGMIPYIMEKVHLILPSGYVKTGKLWFKQQKWSSPSGLMVINGD